MTAIDQAIRDEALNPRQSFIVEAPAGSGKTTLLVQRFLKLLEVSEPTAILAITFTRKAAAEMKARIHKALDCPISNLNIMTIDAFCRQIVMRQPLESGMLGTQMLEDETALKADLLTSLLEAIESNDEGAADFIQLFQHFDNNLDAAVTELLKLLKNREEWLPLILQNPLQEMQASIHALNAGVENITEIKKCIPELFTQKWTLRKKVPAHLQTLHQELQDNPTLCETYIHSAHLPDPTEQPQAILKVLLRALPLVAAHLQVVLLKRQETDYHEIALSALRLLQDPTKGILAKLDYEIKHILVDEFQDTSKLQFQLLQLLTEEWSSQNERTLFLVGDPKQSIYRFRNADVGLFLDVKQNGLNHLKLKPLQLRQNFRTTDQLLEYINQTCSRFFPHTENECLGAVPYVKSHSNIPSSKTAVFAESFENEVEEARWVAEQIKNLRDQPSIAILVRARNHYAAIIQALTEAGLHFSVKEDRRWLDSPFVDDLCSLLYAIHHPADKLSWFSLLHSPLCNWSIREIQIFSESGAPLSDALPAFKTLSPEVPLIRFKQALAQLDCTLTRSEFAILKRFEEFLLQFDTLPELPQLKEKLQRYDFGEITTTGQIQLLTIHQAKGLEFDAVFLPCLQKRTGRDDAPLLYTETFYQQAHFHFLLAEKPQKGGERSSLYTYLHWLEGKRAQYETMRLLYVAMTRAKLHLFLSHVGDTATKGSLLSLLHQETV